MHGVTSASTDKMRSMPNASHNHPNRPGNGLHSQNESREGYSQKENGVPVPGAGGFRNGMMPGAPMFDLARSPPGAPNKNTKHVPCKFFRQGTCQAGNACPFSHSLDPLTHQAPCKYFSKGNCKFGAKCALAHYLPDGRRVNRSDIDNAMGPSRGFNYSRQDSMQYPNTEMPIDPRAAQQYPNDYFGGGFFDADDHEPYPGDRYNRPYQQGDSALNSPPTSQFGSPPNDSQFPKSPMDNVRTALNVPMPQSFDPSEPLHLVPFGGIAGTSAPVHGPPPFSSPGAASSLSRRLASPPDTGSYRNMNAGTNMKSSSPLGASPQNQDESIDRIMHSSLKPSKPRGISASVPRPGMHPRPGDDLGAETDLLPGSLHDEVLTPAEQMRRLSRADQDGALGMAIPSGQSSKVGSPPTGGSPSRFSHIWAEQREKREPGPPPGLGHVGSPLRESWMPTESGLNPRGSQVSGISQAMQRMQLSRTESNESNSGKPQSSGLRHSSNPLSRIDRTISSPGLPPRRIDEEGEGVFFPMDDDKRSSSIWSSASPRLAPLREKANGEISRSKKDDLGPGASGMSSLYGFRP